MVHHSNLSETVWYPPDLSEPSNLSDHPDLRESRSDRPELSASPIFGGGHLPVQSHPGPGHPGSQGRWLIIRIRVIWLDLPLLFLNCTHSVIWTFCLTLKTTFWPTFTSVNLRQEPGLVTFNVDERFFTSLHNYMFPIAGHECSHINHVKTPVNGDRLSNTLLKIAFSTSNFSDNMLLSSRRHRAAETFEGVNIWWVRSRK